MNTKKTILIIILSLMILIVFIFQQPILKLDDTLLFVSFGIAIVVMAITAGLYVNSEFKKKGIKDIPLDNKVWLILIAYIAWPATAIIFAIIGMISITIWMIFLLFTVLGVYLIYFSIHRIFEGKIYSIFGYYDKKKNYKVFIIVNVIDIIGGILLIGFGIFVLTALL